MKARGVGEIIVKVGGWGASVVTSSAKGGEGGNRTLFFDVYAQIEELLTSGLGIARAECGHDVRNQLGWVNKKDVDREEGDVKGGR